jgi:hypothetical protein
MSKQIPSENINICFVGGVSTGKSTGLNSVFCEQFTECKIKRTTMLPTVYIENESGDRTSDDILKTITDSNTEIINRESENIVFTIDSKLTTTCKELIFDVGKLDINILDDSYVNIYDIPGLNDAKTKDVFYNYLDENFFKFNMLIFFVDINSGLNTSDEMEMLKFICEKTKDQLDNNNRKISTLVIVNKADDMQLEEGKLVLMGEMKEMFEQVNDTVKNEFKKNNISEQLIGVIPMCALDSYLYRMVKKHGDRFVLSPQQIQKIGINEMGKKFSMKTKLVQEQEVKKILKDNTFIENMIQLSGFSQLEYLLRNFLSDNDKGRKLRIDNILFKLRKLPDITKLIVEKGLTYDYLGLIDDYSLVYCQIKTIDKDEYNIIVTDFVKNMMDAVKEVIITSRYVESFVCDYDTFVVKFVKPHFSEFYSTSEYPQFLTNHIVDCIGNIVSNNVVKISSFVAHIEMLIYVGKFNKSNLNLIFTNLISNVRHQNTIDFGDDTYCDNLTAIFDKCKEDDVDISNVLRFILINKLQYDGCLNEKIMIYKRYGEIPVLNYMEHLNMAKNLGLINSGQVSYAFKYNMPVVNVAVYGLTESILKSQSHILDLYYLNCETKKKTLNMMSGIEDKYSDCRGE